MKRFLRNLFMAFGIINILTASTYFILFNVISHQFQPESSTMTIKYFIIGIFLLFLGFIIKEKTPEPTRNIQSNRKMSDRSSASCVQDESSDDGYDYRVGEHGAYSYDYDSGSGPMDDYEYQKYQKSMEKWDRKS